MKSIPHALLACALIGTSACNTTAHRAGAPGARSADRAASLEIPTHRARVVSPKAALSLFGDSDLFPASALKRLAVGARVAVRFDLQHECPEYVTQDPFDPTAIPLHRHLEPGKSHTFVVQKSLVELDDEPRVALLLSGESSFWVHLASWGTSSCVALHDGVIDRASEFNGKRVFFNPSAATCTTLRARSEAALRALRDERLGARHVLDDFVIGSGNAAGEGSQGPTPWFSFQGNPIWVDEATLSGCFSETLRLREKDRTARLLQLDPAQCVDVPGQPGVQQCSPTTGAWQRARASGVFEYQRVRRTTAGTFLRDGKPADAREAVGTPLILESVATPDERLTRATEALRASVEEQLKQSDLGVRLLPAGSEGAAATVRLELTALHLGELATRSEKKTSKFKVRDDVKPNPEHPIAQEKLASAVGALRDAEVAYQLALKLAEQAAAEAKKKCEEDARKSSNDVLKGFGGVLGAACGAAVQVVGQNLAEWVTLSSAKKNLDEARTKARNTPETLTIPVMEDWEYTQEVFSRSASLTVQLSATDSAGATTRKEKTFPREFRDHNVAEDAPHNVKGNVASGPWIQDPSAMIPPLTRDLAGFVTDEVNRLTKRLVLQKAVADMRASGVTPREGYEDLFGLAHRMVRGRLRKAIFTGLKLGKGAERIRFKDLPEDRCQLVVAMTSEEDQRVSLASVDGKIADQRGLFFAGVEVCGNHFQSPAEERILLLDSPGSGEVRYAVFSLDGRTTTDTDEALPRTPEAPPRGPVHGAPVEALAVHLRPSVQGWAAGSLDSRAIGEIFSGTAPGIALGFGARVSRGTHLYLEWERAAHDVGDGSAYARLDRASARGDRLSMGLRKYYRPDSWVGFLLDVQAGYGGLTLSGQDQAGNSASFSLKGGQAALALGPWFRLHRLVSLEPFAGLRVQHLMTYTQSTTLAGDQATAGGSPEGSFLLGWTTGVSATAKWDWIF